MSKEIEDAAAKFVQSQEQSQPQEEQPKKKLGNVKDLLNNESTPTKVFGGKKFPINDDDDSLERPSMMMPGYIPITMSDLPSQGIFYPINTRILIKAASSEEILHWSLLDESSPVVLDENLNWMLEKLTQVQMPGKRATYKDLLDLDRLYIIFAISEYTFKNGENKIMAQVKHDNGDVEKVQITKDSIKLFEIPEKLQRFYSYDKRCFTFDIEGETIDLSMPCIGLSKFLYDLRQSAEREGKSIDMDALRYALFIFKDWRGMTEARFKELSIDRRGWSVKKISLLSKFVDLMAGAINPQMTVMTSAGEVTQQLNFQGGFKSLFTIPDILDELA